MKRTTKIVLNILFCLGLITAALSIGRAATSTYTSFTVDTSCEFPPLRIAYVTQRGELTCYADRLELPLFFTLVETKLGTIMACGPALRQFFVYRNRTKTVLPSSQRQQPNEDFEDMRHRVNVRDFFWRGKRDPMRAQGLANAQRRLREDSTYTNAGFSEKVDPEDSPLSLLEHRIVRPVASG